MRTAKIVATVLLRPLQFVVWAVAGPVRRDPSWWAFGSWSGQRFSDNAAALFLKAASAGEPPKVTWITSRRTIANDLRGRGLDARLRWSPAGIVAGLRAGVYVYDGYTKDVNHWLSNGATCILLRHGVGMKKADRGIDVPGHRLHQLFHGRWWQRLFWGAVLPWHAVRPDYALATSDEHATQAVEYFGVRRDHVLVTGFPRQDALFDSGATTQRGCSVVRAIRDEKQTTILFMPTFRDGFGRHDFLWDEFERAASAAGVKVFVKLHIIDAQRGTVGDERWDQRRSLTLVDPTIDPVTLYPHVDALITDFSSTGFDFMLLRKPLIYFVPDQDEFLSMRSLYYPFDEVTPGSKCRTFDELVVAMQHVVDVGIGPYADQYDQLLGRFYQHRDGRSSERALRELCARLLPGEETVPT